MYKNELGINFTNVLGNVLSLNPNNASSPYGLTYRRHYAKWSLRSALNINLDNLNEDDFENGNFINRKLNTIGGDTRIGVEKHLVLSKKMMFSYGIDALFGIEKNIRKSMILILEAHLLSVMIIPMGLGLDL